MARHKALPEKYTPEQLGVWLTENAVDKRTHTEEVPLTEESKAEFREKIALSTAAIYDLKDIEKAFKDSLNNGTNFDGNERKPDVFTIPPTKGLKELEANRQFADKVLKQGFTTVETEVFGIPYKKEIIFFDGGGEEYFKEPAPHLPDQLFDEEATDHAKEFRKSMKKVVGDSKLVIYSEGQELFDSDKVDEEGSVKDLFG